MQINKARNFRRLKAWFLKIGPLLFVGLVFAFLILWVGQKFKGFTKSKLTEGLTGQPHLINPLYADLNPVDKLLSSLIYRGLIKYNQAGLPEGDLAQKWEVAADGKTYLVTLKDGLYFHDGQRLSAKDVVFTYKLTQLPEYQGPKKSYFQGVEIAAQGNKIIKFTLKQPLSSFLEALKLGILPWHIWKNKSIEQILRSKENLVPIGIGNVKMDQNGLKIRGNYRVASLALNVQKGGIKKIQFKFYQTDRDLLNAYKLGEIDSLTLVNANLAKELENWPNLQFAQKELYASQFLLLFNNHLKSANKEVGDLLQNGNFRKALKELIYYKVFASKAFLGPIPKTSWAYEEPTKNKKITAAEIKKLTSKFAGAPDLTLTLAKKPPFPTLAKQIQTEMKKVGLNVRLEILDGKEFEKEVLVNKDFQILLLGRSIGVDPDQYVYWHSSQNTAPGLNIASFSNRRIDKALEEGRISFDQKARKNYYDSFQEEINKELPAIFLSHPRIFYFYPQNLQAKLPKFWWEAGNRFKYLSEWHFE